LGIILRNLSTVDVCPAPFSDLGWIWRSDSANTVVEEMPRT
jgi:hypothetical protein